jgi:hypothetical protein
MRKLLVNILLTLVRWLGYSPYGLSKEVLKAAYIATREVERKFPSRSGEGKRAQVLRVLMNLCPNESEGDMGKAIEVCRPR